MKYDERDCKFNMDTGCVELLLRDGRKIRKKCSKHKSPPVRVCFTASGREGISA